MIEVSTWVWSESKDRITVHESEAVDARLLAFAHRGWKSRGSNWSGWTVQAPDWQAVRFPYAGPFRNKALATRALRVMAARVAEQTP